MNYTLAIIVIVIAVLGGAYFAGYFGPTAWQPSPLGATTTTQMASTSTTHGTPYTQQVSPKKPVSTVATTTANCHLNVTVSGGLFAPTACVFEAVTGGVCKQGACPETYALRLKDPVAGRVQTVVLAPGSRSSGVYTYKTGANNLKGDLTDAQGLSWAPASAAMTLSPQAEEKMGITFDATFTNGVKVSGTGTLPTTHVSAP